jgi:pimeloyl-ACP methyl ester carboxylesterase
MPNRSVALPAGAFHVRLAGPEDAPPILLLHGFPEHSGAWVEVVGELAPRFRCIVPDQRGYGPSFCPPGVADYALRHLVADALGLLDALAPGVAPTVVGHDWGASVAYGLAFAAPARVRRLVVLNGVHPIPFQRALAAGGAQTEASQYIAWLRREGSEAKLAEDGCARLMSFFGKGMDLGWFDAARRAEYLAAWSRPGRLRAMVDWYRASPLVVPPPGRPAAPAGLPALDPARLRVRVPHLLIWGLDDSALLPESRAGLDALCDDLRVVELAGCDHWLHHQKPAEVARLIADFAAG